VAVYWLGAQLWDWRIGGLAALWLAIYPGHFTYAMHFLSEGPYALLLALGVGVSILSLRQGASSLGVLAGLIWGAATLIRPQFLFTMILALVILAASRSARKAYGRNAAIQLIMASAVIGVWVTRNRIVVGKALLASNSGTTFWGSHNDIVIHDPDLIGGWVKASTLFDENHHFTGDELEDDRRGWRYGFEWIETHRSLMPWLVVRKIRRLLTPFPLTENRMMFWATALSWGITGPLTALGLFVAFRKDRFAATMLALPLVGTILNCAIFFGNNRFRDSVASIYVIFTAVGLLALFDAIIRARRTNLEGPFASKTSTG
jgi:4-amino-4-deoxy-L-arabinose transferase-like glycosyltransferase